MNIAKTARDPGANRGGLRWIRHFEWIALPKADLGEKVLYKYTDIAVECHNGKVADVRWCDCP